MSNQILLDIDESGSQLVKNAKEIAERLVKDKLKTNQIRNIFTEVRQIEAMWRNSYKKDSALRRLNMLKPKMAYQAARESSVKLLAEKLTQAIDEIDRSDPKERDDRFQIFIDFFEAILAYHRSQVIREK